MILLYTLLLLLLGVTRLLLSRRAAALERSYVKASLAADKLLHASVFKGGANKHDQCQAAKRQYQLGQLVQQRDRLEAKYGAWQQRAERVAKAFIALRHWKGKTLPYTCGALDGWCALQLIDHFGVGDFVSARALLQYVTTLLNMS